MLEIVETHDLLVQALLATINQQHGSPGCGLSEGSPQTYAIPPEKHVTMGLRALCCSSGDRDDNDGPNLAPRPSQTQLDQPTQKPTANADNEPSGTQSPSEKRPPTPRNLWKEAYDSLDEGRQKYVPATGLPVTDAIQGVIDSTTTNYEKWQKGGLRIHHKDGEDTNLRDWAENILGAAMKAQGIISTVVSFDPTGHGEFQAKFQEHMLR